MQNKIVNKIKVVAICYSDFTCYNFCLDDLNYFSTLRLRNLFFTRFRYFYIVRLFSHLSVSRVFICVCVCFIIFQFVTLMVPTFLLKYFCFVWVIFIFSFDECFEYYFCFLRFFTAQFFIMFVFIYVHVLSNIHNNVITCFMLYESHPVNFRRPEFVARFVNVVSYYK